MSPPPPTLQPAATAPSSAAARTGASTRVVVSIIALTPLDRHERTVRLARRSHIAAGHTIVSPETVAGNSVSVRESPDGGLAPRHRTAARPCSQPQRLRSPGRSPRSSPSIPAPTRADHLRRRAPRRAGGRPRGRPRTHRGRRARRTQPRTRRLGRARHCSPGSRGSGPTGRERRTDRRSCAASAPWSTPFTLVFVLHLALACPEGGCDRRRRGWRSWRHTRSPRRSTVAGALFRDPLLDLYCWRNCRDNSFLVHADAGIASVLERRLALVGARDRARSDRIRLRTGCSGPPARGVGPCCRLLGPALLVGAHGGDLRDRPAADAARGPGEHRVRRDLPRPLALVHRARARPGLEHPACAAHAGARRRGSRATSERRRHPGSCATRSRPRSATRASTCCTRGADSGQLIDADGRPAEPPASGRAVARITRGDRPLALVLHDPALVDEPELERALGSAAKLAVENEALRAEALAQLHELQRVAHAHRRAGDDARRRLERDLHDGAQQRLLALSYDLRLARAGAAGDDDEELVAAARRGRRRDRHRAGRAARARRTASTRRS